MRLKVMTIIYLITVYISLIWVMCNCYNLEEMVNANLGPGAAMVFVYGAIPIIIAYLATMIVLFTMGKEIKKDNSSSMHDLNLCMLLIKCGMVPFFLVILVVFVILTIFISLLLGSVEIVPIIMGIVISGCTLFMTFSYCLFIYIVFYKKGYLTRKTLVVHILSQLVFCVDVIAAIVAYNHLKGKIKEKDNIVIM